MYHIRARIIRNPARNVYSGNKSGFCIYTRKHNEQKFIHPNKLRRKTSNGSLVIPVSRKHELLTKVAEREKKNRTKINGFYERFILLVYWRVSSVEILCVRSALILMNQFAVSLPLDVCVCSLRTRANM